MRPAAPGATEASTSTFSTGTDPGAQAPSSLSHHPYGLCTPRRSAGRLSALPRAYGSALALLAILAGTLSALTLPAAALAAAPCPNEQLRSENNSAQLPDCRAFELVTPSDKLGTFAVSVEGPNPETPFVSLSGDGQHVLYRTTTQGAFGDASNGFRGEFVADRTSGGWSTSWVGAPVPAEHPSLADILVPVAGSSTFSTLFYTPEIGIDPNDQNGVQDVYAREPNGSFAWVSQDGALETAPVASSYVGSSADRTSDVLFQTTQALTPSDAGQVAGFALYDRAHGQTVLVGIDTAGSLTSTCGAVLGNDASAAEVAVQDTNAVSSDGSRIFFESPDPGGTGAASCSPQRGGSQPVEVYLREHAASTTEVSLSQKTGSVGAQAPDGATYQGASRDGSRVFFTSPDQLTDNAVPPAPFAEDLYVYDVASRVLTFIASGKPFFTNQGFSQPQISGDGSHVYFTGNVPGVGLDNSATGGSLYLWDEGRISYIAPAPAHGENGEAKGESGGEASADGSALVFTSTQSLTGYSNKGFNEIYLYRQADASLVCISCNPGGSGPVGHPTFAPFQTIPSQVISEDGGRVFFDSPDRLVPQATNGLYNVYEYERGSVHLLSDGGGSHASRLLGASSDGADVAIVTQDSLAPEDQNGGEVDLYDVRVDGGFPAPAAPARCEADGCQGPLGAPPAFSSAGSAAFPAGDNLAVPASSPSPTRTAAQIKAAQLNKALKVCHAKKNRKKRASCEAQARKRYGAKASTKAKKSRHAHRKTGGSR
jgi:hypothetical protein